MKKLILWVLLRSVSEKTRTAIKMDAVHNAADDFSLKLLEDRLKTRSMRSVLEWRINDDIKNWGGQKWKCTWLKFLRKSFEIICPPLKSIEIYVKDGLGGDFYLPHSYCIVNARKIGEHVTVSQGVTVGKDKTGNPTIGNNVIIYPNAVVVGGINIGDNVVVGANAFVNFDVQDNSTVRAPKGVASEYVPKH